MRKELLTPEIIKLTKSLKRQIVEITPHYICGSDSMMSEFSIIYLNGSVQVDSELYYFGPTTGLAGYDENVLTDCSYDMLRSKMNYLRNACQMADNNKVLFSANNIIKQDIVTGLVESIASKAKDGMMLTWINDKEYIMSSCSTMHPINKPDTVDITIYEYNELSFLAKYDIKKKNYTIHEYIAYLYLN